MGELAEFLSSSGVQVTTIDKLPNHTDSPRSNIAFCLEIRARRPRRHTYHGDLYSDLWKTSDLYFRPAAERPRVNVKVVPGSTLTYKRDLLYKVSILFTRVKLTSVRTEKLRVSGNQPLRA